MCRRCEEIEGKDDCYIQYTISENGYIAYSKDTKEFEFWDDEDFTSDQLVYLMLDHITDVLNFLINDQPNLARHELIDSLETFNELKQRNKM